MRVNWTQLAGCLSVLLVMLAGYKYGEIVYQNTTPSESFILNSYRLFSMVFFGMILIWIASVTTLIRDYWKHHRKIKTDYIAYW